MVRQLPKSVFLGVRAFNLATQAQCHKLHSVADAKHRQTFDIGEIEVRRILFKRATGSAAQDHGVGSIAFQAFVCRCPRDHFTVDSEFPNSANDQLGVLSTEINDENSLVRHGC